MARAHRRLPRARRTVPPADVSGSESSGDDAGSDGARVRAIRRPSQVQLSALPAVAHELSAADDGGGLWRPGMRHDDDLNPLAVCNFARPTCRPVASGDSSSQIKVDWARLNAILRAEESPPPVTCVDRASGPDASPELHAGTRSCTAQRSQWYLVGGTALFGVGCALGFGLALSVGLGNGHLALLGGDAAQVPAPELQMHDTADALSKCRAQLFVEQNERSRAETAEEKCGVDRKHLLEQLHWLATKMAKPSR